MPEILRVNGVSLLRDTTVVRELLEVGVQGPPGPPGEGLQIRGGLADVSELPDDAEIGWAYVIDGEAHVWDGLVWENIGPVLGPQGTQGNGIASVARTAGTGAAGTTDTYTITFTDGSTTTFDVVNGADGGDGAPGIDGASITAGVGEPTAPAGTGDLYIDVETGGLYRWTP